MLRLTLLKIYTRGTLWIFFIVEMKKKKKLASSLVERCHAVWINQSGCQSFSIPTMKLKDYPYYFCWKPWSNTLGITVTFGYARSGSGSLINISNQPPPTTSETFPSWIPKCKFYFIFQETEINCTFPPPENQIWDPPFQPGPFESTLNYVCFQ